MSNNKINPPTREQIALVAELRTNEGYQLLLDALQAEIDTVGDYLAKPGDHKYILPFWQALRFIYSVLKYKPEDFHAAISDETGERNNEEVTPEELMGDPEMLEQLKAAIIARRKSRLSKG